MYTCGLSVHMYTLWGFFPHKQLTMITHIAVLHKKLYCQTQLICQLPCCPQSLRKSMGHNLREDVHMCGALHGKHTSHMHHMYKCVQYCTMFKMHTLAHRPCINKCRITMTEPKIRLLTVFINIYLVFIYTVAILQ